MRFGTARRRMKGCSDIGRWLKRWRATRTCRGWVRGCGRSSAERAEAVLETRKQGRMARVGLLGALGVGRGPPQGGQGHSASERRVLLESRCVDVGQG